MTINKIIEGFAIVSGCVIIAILAASFMPDSVTNEIFTENCKNMCISMDLNPQEILINSTTYVCECRKK